MNLPGNDGEGDESAHGNPTTSEAPWHGFDSAWNVVATMAEATVGTMFTFRGQRMKIVQDEKRRAIGIQNKHTGKVDWVPMDVGFFGFDQVSDHVDLGDYRGAGIATWETELGKTLQKDSARAPRRSVRDEWAKRGADLSHRSIFKPKFERNRRIA
jgi:hypothetical protein